MVPLAPVSSGRMIEKRKISVLLQFQRNILHSHVLGVSNLHGLGHESMEKKWGIFHSLSALGVLFPKLWERDRALLLDVELP